MSIHAAQTGGQDHVPKRQSWRNWAGNLHASPIEIFRPTTEDEIVALVEQAANRGLQIKAFGAKHSFSGIAVSDDYVLDLTNYDQIVEVDSVNGYVTVQSGKKLSHLSEELFTYGFAMEDMGDIAYQSIAGAISTGTHGTGATFGCIPTQVHSMRIITADGSVLNCSKDEHQDIFHAARVSLGALGIISTITLKCETAFNLHAVEKPIALDEVMTNLDDFIDSNEHFEFFWQPNMQNAFTKQNNRTTRPEEPLTYWENFKNDVLIGDFIANNLVKVDRIAPPVSRFIRRNLPVTFREDYVDRSYRVFTSERKVKFVEMEYFIPRAAAKDAMKRYRAFLQQTGIIPSMSIEMRFTAADDIPLSMSTDRETCSFAIHLRTHERYQQYFEGFETLMREFDGRPHWGKMHFQTKDTLMHLYPQWEQFQVVRKKLDPDGRFTNAYLNRVLGQIE